LRFPELFRQAVKNRAQILSIIACWPQPREEHWLALLRARAIENQCFVAAVNRGGRDPSGLSYGGRSQIIDPFGAILADGGSKEGVIEAEVDLAMQAKYRHDFPALNDVRPKL
jgi:predicted amidohydrolase